MKIVNAFSRSGRTFGDQLPSDRSSPKTAVVCQIVRKGTIHVGLRCP